MGRHWADGESEAKSRMREYLNGGKERGYVRRFLGPATMEKVTTAAFCDVDRCSEMASWRIGYGTQSVEFCAKHTVSTMRSRKLWLGRS